MEGEGERRQNMQGARAGGILSLFSGFSGGWMQGQEYSSRPVVIEAAEPRGAQQVCQSQVGQLPSQRGTWFPREVFPKVWAST